MAGREEEGGEETLTSMNQLFFGDNLQALNHVREREKAEIGLLISLEEPTRGMKADAASAGFYTSDVGKQFSRVQILTIDGLLSGNQRAEHPEYIKNVNFKKAKREARPKVNKTLFDPDQ